MTSSFVEHYPYPHHPLVPDPDGPEGATRPDVTVTVEVFQLRPTDQQRLLDWAGGGILLADGGVILTDGETILGRLALGDFAVLDQTGVRCEPADGFAQRFTPVDSTATSPPETA